MGNPVKICRQAAHDREHKDFGNLIRVQGLDCRFEFVVSHLCRLDQERYLIGFFYAVVPAISRQHARQLVDASSQFLPTSCRPNVRAILALGTFVITNTACSMAIISSNKNTIIPPTTHKWLRPLIGTPGQSTPSICKGEQDGCQTWRHWRCS